MTNTERIEKENFFYITTMNGIEIYAKYLNFNGQDCIQIVEYLPEADYVVSWNDIKPLYTYELMSKVFTTLECADKLMKD